MWKVDGYARINRVRAFFEWKTNSFRNNTDTAWKKIPSALKRNDVKSKQNENTSFSSIDNNRARVRLNYEKTITKHGGVEKLGRRAALTLVQDRKLILQRIVSTRTYHLTEYELRIQVSNTYNFVATVANNFGARLYRGANS